VFAKLHWIRAGSQSKWSWAFLLIELTVMCMNVVLANQISKGHVADWMQPYYTMSPSTPILAFVGWILLFMTDKAKVLTDKRRSMFDAIEVSEMEHQALQHTTMMALKKDIMAMSAEHMRKEVQLRRPEIERATALIVSQQISGLIGTYIAPVSNAKIVESNAPPVQKIAQNHLVEPYKPTSTEVPTAPPDATKPQAIYTHQEVIDMMRVFQDKSQQEQASAQPTQPEVSNYKATPTDPTTALPVQNN
jgi:hypothetical protein